MSTDTRSRTLPRIGPVTLPSLAAPTVGLMLLIAAICVSPRIPVPISIGRRFDLRLEDFVLAALTLRFLLQRDWRQARAERLVQLFAVYLVVALLSTAFNIALFGLPLLRGVAFWGKNLEYFLILVLAACWAASATDRRWLLRTLLGMGLVNLAWVGFQLLTHSYHSLVEFSSVNEWSYGPGLIGEVSPLSVGSFFLIQGLLWWAIFSLRRNWRTYLACGLMIVALVLTESRVSYLGSALGAALISFRTGRFFRSMAGFAAAFVASLVILTLSGSPSLVRVTGVYYIEQSFAYRLNEIWEPLASKYLGVVIRHAAPPTATEPTPVPTPRFYGHDEAPPPPTAASRKPPAIVQVLIGYGNGAMGYAPGLPTEAHDQFLRVFLETGIVGLMAFVALLISLASRVLAGVRHPAQPDIDRVVALALAGTLFAFFAGSLLQDMFFPVIPNELLWLLAGLLLAPVLAARRGVPTEQGG